MLLRDMATCTAGFVLVSIAFEGWESLRPLDMYKRC